MNLLSSSNFYDHEFVCLSLGIDPHATPSADSAESLNGFPPSAEAMIKSKYSILPNILKNYVDLLSKQFDWRGYMKRNSDLSHLAPHKLVEHFIEYGLKEPRHWRMDARLLDRRFAWAVQSEQDTHLKTRILAVVHCYHFHVLCSQLHYLKLLARIGAQIHLLVANQSIANSALDDFLDSISSGATSHTWARVDNFGEDWSSFHSAYLSGIFDCDSVVFKLQTKLSKNLGADGGSAWIDEALAPICGNHMAINHVLNDLANDGIVIAASSATSRIGFGENPELITSFKNKLALREDINYSCMPFSSGSMFAAKSSFIRKFYRQLGDVNYQDIAEGGSAYCGRYAGHAIERSFFYFAQSNRHPGLPDPIVWL